MKIGFIGMGIMGRPMARNLIKAGYDVTVASRTPAHCETVREAGAKVTDFAGIARESDVIFTMLPNSPEVREVLLGEKGIAGLLHAGQTVIDTSSIDPLESRAIAAELARYGVEMLDAPVSGGEPKAIDGTLSFMVGGKREVFDRYSELLGAMGSSVVYCGEIGAGNTTKLANQVIVAANIAAVAEGLMLAKRAGVDPETVYHAIRGGLAGSTVMDAKGTMMLAGNTKPGFRIDLHIKDLNNAVNVAHAVGAPLPVTANVMEILQYLHANGFGDCDHSAIAAYYERLTGESLCKTEE